MKKVAIVDVILLVLSLLLAIGVHTVMGPCVHEDGSFGTCHWAGEGLFSLGLILAIQSMLRFFAARPVKTGLSLAMIPTAIFVCILPGNLIPLCMMNTMRCNAVMRPFALILGIAIAAAVLADLIWLRKKD